MPPSSFFVRDFVVWVTVGAILLRLLSRLIGRVQFSLSTAFWCSFIGHTFISVIGLFAASFFAYHLIIGIVLVSVVGFVFQIALFKMFVRAKGGILAGWRAAILSLIVILGDFFVASPLIHLWEYFRT
jgi:hypothetical protein